MNALDMALRIEAEHEPGLESLQAFVLRKFSQEKMSTLREAMEICIQRERIIDELSAVIDALNANSDHRNVTIEQMIKYRRSFGYDSKLEALLARIWVCPQCSERTTILGVAIPPARSKQMPACAKCGREGIAPHDGSAPALALVAGGKQ